MMKNLTSITNEQLDAALGSEIEKCSTQGVETTDLLDALFEERGRRFKAAHAPQRVHMRRNTTAQDRANNQAYDDGVRCRRKGLGLTKSGKYDFDAWRRCFDRGFRKAYPSIDREESYNAWVEGWNDEDDRLGFLAEGILPCGRPI